MAFIKRTIIFIILLAIGSGVYVTHWASQPLAIPGNNPAEFSIKPGSGVRSAMRQVQEGGVPVEPLLMELLARISGRAGAIKAGYYRLKPQTSPLMLLNQIVKGDTIKESLTIIEGWTFAQMRAEIARQNWLKQDTGGLTETALMEKINSDYDLAEGLFYPDTYVYSRGTSDFEIYQISHARMLKKLEQAWANRDADVPYRTPYEALIMASIVEKETGRAAERKRIAAVFVNRLRSGMLLQTDPTVIYGMGASFDGNIRKQDLQTDTPYNTYKRSGLPPTPIALPGNDALEAALKPAATNDLYFVARGDGSSEFSENLSDHNKAVNKYQR